MIEIDDERATSATLSRAMVSSKARLCKMCDTELPPVIPVYSCLSLRHPTLHSRCGSCGRPWPRIVTTMRMALNQQSVSMWSWFAA